MTKMRATIAVLSEQPNLNGVTVVYNNPEIAFKELVGKCLGKNVVCIGVSVEGNHVVGYFRTNHHCAKDIKGLHPLVEHEACARPDGGFNYIEGSGVFIEPFFSDTHSDYGAEPLEGI